MYIVNEDLSIYATRGDIVCINVSATREDNGQPYEFQVGDIVRFSVYGKKDAETVYLQKDFPVVADTDAVGVLLTEEDTKFGDIISKPTDYWYEVTLNPYTNPQTLIGYDEDGAKIFKLFPEGNEVEDVETDPADIPVVDEEIDPTSPRPVENRAIWSALTTLESKLEAALEELGDRITEIADKLL